MDKSPCWDCPEYHDLMREREAAQAACAKVADDLEREYAALIAKGKGSHGDANYVRDNTWASWHGQRMAAETIARMIRAIHAPSAECAVTPSPASRSDSDGSRSIRLGATEIAAALTDAWHREFFTGTASDRMNDWKLGELTRRIATALVGEPVQRPEQPRRQHRDYGFDCNNTDTF